MSKGPAGGLGGGAAEDFFRRRIHLRHLQMLVDLDDGVHRAADEPPEFLLALAHLRFDAQPAQLGRRPCGENLK